jgi:hypothetical protein
VATARPIPALRMARIGARVAVRPAGTTGLVGTIGGEPLKAVTQR